MILTGTGIIRGVGKSPTGALIAAVENGTTPYSLTSPNGITWNVGTAGNKPIKYPFVGMVATRVSNNAGYFGGFTAITSTSSSRPAFLTSADGITWTVSATTPPIQDLVSICISQSGSSSGYWGVVVFSTGEILTSYNNSTWVNSGTYNIAHTSQALVWADSLGKVISVGSGTNRAIVQTTAYNIYTLGAVSFTGSIGMTQNCANVEWSDSLGLAVATKTTAAATTSGAIFTSPNGTTWTERTASVAGTWKGIAWSPTLGKFIILGSTATSMTSTNGTTWSSITLPGGGQNIIWSSTTLRFIVTANDAETIYSSTDGVNWSTSYTPGASAWFIASDF